MGRNIINRRASKRASISLNRACREAEASLAKKEKLEKEAALPASTKPSHSDCPDFVPEKDNCYPLCDNLGCPRKHECNLSAHMIGPYDKK